MQEIQIRRSKKTRRGYNKAGEESGRQEGGKRQPTGGCKDR
jgi:hypothetical protein